MATVDEVLMAARTHLNDDQNVNWPDPNLRPKLQEAFRDLQLELELNGIQVLNEVTADITVTAGATDLSLMVGYPTDIVSPTWMKEKQVGETDAFLRSMTPVDFIPNVDRDIILNWWCWRENKILLLGALVDVIVQLRYRKKLVLPELNSDDIGVILGESYLSDPTAALACNAAKDPKGAMYNDARADVNLAKLIQYYTTYEKQMLPAKRMAYHRRNWFKNSIRSI